MPRKIRLSGAEERKRAKEREAKKIRVQAEALGLKIATPADDQPEANHADLLAARSAMGDPPADTRRLPETVAQHLAGLAREAELDMQVPARVSREQAARIWALVGKHAAAANESDELDELEGALQDLRKNAGHVQTAEKSPASSSSPIPGSLC